MKITETIGSVTLSKWHPSLGGATWRVAVPLSWQGLLGKQQGRGEPIVVYDELGAAEGSLMAVSDGAEAAAPFYPEQKPIDAYNAAILDTVDVAVQPRRRSTTSRRK